MGKIIFYIVFLHYKSVSYCTGQRALSYNGKGPLHVIMNVP
ncbi:hypothetical protein QF041_002791 [Paenibacillus sp. W2I17]|nr:hypothetical protein [Paenibacillus sp. W2I17]